MILLSFWPCPVYSLFFPVRDFYYSLEKYSVFPLLSVSLHWKKWPVLQCSHSTFWHPLYLCFFLCFRTSHYYRFYYLQLSCCFYPGLSLVLNLQSPHFSQNLNFQPFLLILLIFCFLLFFLLDLNCLSHHFFRYFRPYLGRCFYRSLRHYLSRHFYLNFHHYLSRHFYPCFLLCLSHHFYPCFLLCLSRYFYRYFRFSLLYLMSPARNYLYLYLYRLHNKPSRSHLSICLQYQLYILPLQYLHTSFHMKLYLFLQNNNNIRLSTASLTAVLPHLPS